MGVMYKYGVDVPLWMFFFVFSVCDTSGSRYYIFEYLDLCCLVVVNTMGSCFTFRVGGSGNAPWSLC